ncbi:MAG: AMP-binding protein, partial [Coprococcus sp.]
MKNVLEFLENSAERYPDKTAIADAENSLSYKELKEKAQCIGSLIIDKLGINSGMARPVAVLMDKCALSLAAFMGVVYSGNFYVVIDAEMPVERVNTIFEALSPVAVLTDELHMEKANELKLSAEGIVLLIEEASDISRIQTDKLNQVRSSMIDTDPVYALFTSGSTGVPKGAVVSHKNVISYTKWYTETFGIDSDTVFGNQTPFYFSMSVSDVYSSLKEGATLQIIPKSLFSFPIKLMEFMNERKINTIYWVPSALCIIANWKMFQYAKLPLLKKVLFAGEVMPTRQLNYWIENLPDATFANLFGPTETTDICTYYVVNRSFADDEPLPMGNACNNCSVFVLDESGQLVTPEIDP